METPQTQPQPEKPTPENTTNTETEQQVSIPPEMPLQIKEKKKLKKPLIISLLAALLLIGGASVWYFVIRDTSTPASDNSNSQSNTSNSQTDEPAHTGMAEFLLYTENVSGLSAQRMTLSDTSVDNSGELTGGTFVINSQVSGDNALIHTSSSAGEQVWVSTDKGKSFKKIFQGEPGGDSSMGDQVTSAVFANDGASLLLAVLSGDRVNTVKEFNLSDATSKDLFTVDKDGVFLYGYDKSAKYVYYDTGCYNCDGFRQGTLLRQTVDSDAAAVEIYSLADNSLASTSLTMSKDLKKAILVSATVNTEEIGFKAPYEVVEVDVATKTATTLKKVDDAAVTYVGAGYTSEGKAYYYQGNSLKLINGDTLLMELGQPIKDVHFVSEHSIIVSAGDYSSFNVYSLDLMEEGSEPVSLLSDLDSSDSNIIGVVADL